MKKIVHAHSVNPPEMVWAKIEDELERQNGSGKWLLIFLLSGIVIAGAYATINYGNVNGIKDSVELTNNDVTINDTNNTSTPELISSNVNIDKLKNESKSLLSLNGKNVKKKNTIVLTQRNDLTKSSSIEKKLGSSTFAHHPVGSENLFSNKNNIDRLDLSSVENENLSELVRDIIDLDQLAKIKYALNYNRSIAILTDKVECPSFKKGAMSFNPFIEFNGLLGRHFKSLGTGLEYANLQKARLESEDSWYAWGGNLSLGLYFARDFYAAVGLDISQSKDRFYFEKDALTKMIVTFDPDTGAPIDTSFIYGTIVNKGEIRYNMIDIPLILGFSKKMSNWEIGFETALLLNIAFDVKGKIFNSNLDISRVENEPAIYKDKLGMGIKASLVFRKYLSRQISVQFKSSYKSYFDEIQHINYELPTKIKYYNFELGLRKDF